MQKSSSETCTETASTDISQQEDSSSFKDPKNSETSICIDAPTSKDSSEIGQQSEEKSSSSLNKETASFHHLHDDSSGHMVPKNNFATSSSVSEPETAASIQSENVDTTQDLSDNTGQKSEEALQNPNSEINLEKIIIENAQEVNESLSCPKENEIAESIKFIDVAISKDLSDNITASAHTDEGSQPNEKARIITESETLNPSGVNNSGQGDNISLIIYVMQ